MSVDIIVAIIGLMGILYIAYRDRNSASDSLVDDALSLVKAVKQEMEEMREDVKELKKNDQLRQVQLDAMTLDLDWYKHGVSVLIGQLRRLGVTPEWTPDDDRTDYKSGFKE